MSDTRESVIIPETHLVWKGCVLGRFVAVYADMRLFEVLLCTASVQETVFRYRFLHLFHRCLRVCNRNPED